MLIPIDIWTFGNPYVDRAASVILMRQHLPVKEAKQLIPLPPAKCRQEKVGEVREVPWLENVYKPYGSIYRGISKSSDIYENGWNIV